MVEVGRECWRLFHPIPLLKQDNWGPVTSIHVQMALELLKGWRLYNLPVQPVLVLGKTHRKNISWCSARPFCVQFVSIACLGTGHHWQKPGCVFFNPPSEVYWWYIKQWCIIDDIPQSLLIWEELQPLTHLCGASLAPLQYVQYLQARMGSKKSTACVKHPWTGQQHKQRNTRQKTCANIKYQR